MALATKIRSSFWSDDDIGNLEPNQKLAVLWVLTNKEINNVGFLKVSKRQFEFDTKLPVSALEGALKGLGRSFVVSCSGGGLNVLAVNFVEYQFGDQAQTEKNLITKNLCKLTMGLEEAFQEAILKRYPALARVFRVLYLPSSPMEAHSSPIQAPYKVQEQSRAEQSRASFGGDGGTDYDLASAAVAELNRLTGSKFNPPLHELDAVVGRLLEVNRDLPGIKKMLARQVALWGADPKARSWLKPGTLFGGNFHDYYGQRDLAVPLKNAAGGRQTAGRSRGEVLQELTVAQEGGAPAEEIQRLKEELTAL